MQPGRSLIDVGSESGAGLSRLIRGVADGTAGFEALVEALLPLIRGERRLDQAALLELSTALVSIERETAKDNRLYGLVNDEGAASVALSESGQIVALNPAATELFAASAGDGLAALRISRPEFAAFTRRLAEHPGPSLLRAHSSASSGGLQTVLMAGAYYPRFRATVLTALRQAWPPSIDYALGDIFALSRSEREILSRLAAGLDSEEIARERGRSVGTVRQQIKSVLTKLGVSSQLSAAALGASVAGLGSVGGRAAGDSSSLPPAQGYEAPLKVYSLDRAGRRIGVRRFGVGAGKPVLFLHGPSFGAGEYPEDRRLARKYGLDVYALERPGYGRTDVVPEDEDALACGCLDILAYLDHERLEGVTVLAHEVALIPALELAARRPDRVAGILAVSAAPPFLELEQIHAIPEHQGIFIHAARHAPWIAHLLVRLLMIRMRRLGPQGWTEVIFGGLPAESEVMARPELLPGVIGTYSFYLNQMGAGFEHDLQMMLADWSPLLAAAQAPLVLVHGSRNETTPPGHLELFRAIRPDVRIELVENAGLSLAVSHPQLLYRRLASLAEGRK